MLRKVAAALTLMSVATAGQAAIPVYGSPGSANPTTYSFVKSGDGDLVAFFVGETASLTNLLGVIAGGVDLGTGLSNEVPLGTSFNYGFVADGTELVFYIETSDSDRFSSIAADNPGGLNHVFASAYAGGDTVGIATFTPGTYVYVGFEDLPGGGDLDYDDIQFVFENTLQTGIIPEPASWALLISGFGLVGIAARRRRRPMADF